MKNKPFMTISKENGGMTMDTQRCLTSDKNTNNKI